MLIVRRSLTELLLEVTNEEILAIAQEQVKRKKLKASSSVQVFRKTAIIGKLGLAAYESSESEQSDQSGDEHDGTNDGFDSDEEIKMNLRSAQKNFIPIEKSIEEYLLKDQMKKESRDLKSKEQDALAKETKTSVPEIGNEKSKNEESLQKQFGETQPDKKYHGNGKRSKERTSRFSENKGNMVAIMPNSVPLPQAPDSSLFNAKVASPTRKRKKSESSDDDRRSTTSSTRSSSKYSRSSSQRHKKSRYDDDSDDYYSSSRRRYKSKHRRSRSRSRSRSTSKSKSRHYSSSSSSSKKRH